MSKTIQISPFAWEKIKNPALLGATQTFTGVNTFNTPPTLGADATGDQAVRFTQLSALVGNYYTKSQLDGGQLDNRYYTETEIDNALALKANLASPALTGTPTLNSKDIFVSEAISVTASATFTNSTNNINLTGIGSLSGLTVGDVIKVSGSTSNDTEYTVEVITNANNVIVNQAHAGGTSSKSLTDESATPNVTVSILAKWYNAEPSLGRGEVDVTSNIVSGVSRSNTTGRGYEVTVSCNATTNETQTITLEGITHTIAREYNFSGVYIGASTSKTIPNGSSYTITSNRIIKVSELR